MVRCNLGPKKAHHFSHAPNAICATQSGETAAHLNAKFHIAATLRNAAGLLVRERCVGSGGDWACGHTRVIRFATEWDAVHVERSLGSLRPDVLLERDGRPQAAIEVYATHAVSDTKAAELGRMGVPWLEVIADPALYDPDTPWTADQPLPAVRHEPRSGWQCSMCRREARERVRAEEEARRRAEERARHRRKAACVRDVYRPGKRPFREVFWAVKETTERGQVRLKLWRDRQRDWLGPTILAGPAPEAMDRAWAEIARRLGAWATRLAARGAHVDPVTGWIPARDLRNVDVDSTYPRRYRREGTGWVGIAADLPRLPEALQPHLQAQPRSDKVRAAQAVPHPLHAWMHAQREAVQPTELAPDPVRRAGRLVDRYQPSGQHRRWIVWREVWPMGQEGWYQGIIYSAGHTGSHAAVCSATAEECESALDEAFYLICAAEWWAGAIVDCPMEWMSVSRSDPFPRWDCEARFVLDPVTHTWTFRSGDAPPG